MFTITWISSRAGGCWGRTLGNASVHYSGVLSKLPLGRVDQFENTHSQSRGWHQTVQAKLNRDDIYALYGLP